MYIQLILTKVRNKNKLIQRSVKNKYGGTHQIYGWCGIFQDYWINKRKYKSLWDEQNKGRPYK